MTIKITKADGTTEPMPLAAAVLGFAEPEPPADPKADKYPKKTDPGALVMAAAVDTATIIGALQKEKGKGFAITGNQVPMPQRLKTGVFEFDLATGGGLPKGRATIVFGPEGCLDAASHINYCVLRPDGSKANSKGGTIKRLYERFHGVVVGGGRGKNRRTELPAGSVFTAPAINDLGRVIHNEITNVVFSGVKECFTVFAGGQSITATADHKFFTGAGYAPLSVLAPGSVVWIHDNTPFTVEESAPQVQRTEVYVKYHPAAPKKVVTSDGVSYEYHRLSRARATVEAGLNGMSLELYLANLNVGVTGMVFVPPEDHVHHLNENYQDDAPKNLVVLHGRVHNRAHAYKEHNNLRFTARPVGIDAIEAVGPRETYDVKMAFPFHNFVADKFVVHNSGKTNLALNAVRECQLEGKKAVYVDLEGTLDSTWASHFGIDLDALIVIKPAYGEECVDAIEAVLRASDVGLVVLDSVAVLTAAKEIEKSTETADVGTSAILMKRLCNKISMALAYQFRNGRDPVMLFLNQTRFKIGCFDYNARVRLADGTGMKIGKIVTQQLPVSVLSVAADGSVVPRTVVGWANNGKGDDFLSVRVQGGNSGQRKMTVTRGHSVFTPAGEVPAGTLKVGDEVLTLGWEFYSPQQHEILLGSILGDGALRFEKNSTRGHVRIGHGPDQREYLSWKAALLGGLKLDKGTNPACTTLRSLEFGRYKTIQKTKGLTHVPQDWVEQISPLAVAIWYMDDGNYSGSHSKWGWGKPSISTRILDRDSLARIADRMVRIGLGRPSFSECRGFVWGKEGAKAFFWGVGKYIPTCMAYKAKAGFASGDGFVVAQQAPQYRVFGTEKVLSVKPKYGMHTKYDLTVEGDHNYMVDGVVVHNTMFGDPETQPGGNTFKFLSSLTVRMSGKSVIDKAFHPEIPVWKETSCTIRKAKIGVYQTKFEYSLALQEIPDLQLMPGQTNSWGTVAGILKASDMLTKEPGGYKIQGDKTLWKTLSAIEEQYLVDPEVRSHLQDMAIGTFASKAMLLEAQGSGAK